jgi:hypothetical protein
MAVQIRKTYRGINFEMLYDEVRDSVEKQGIVVGEPELQTYGLPSGSTQSRAVLVFKTKAEREEDQKSCGSAHIIESPGGETKMIIEIDEDLFPQEKVTAFQGELDFILGSYEVKW